MTLTFSWIWISLRISPLPARSNILWNQTTQFIPTCQTTILLERIKQMRTFARSLGKYIYAKRAHKSSRDIWERRNLESGERKFHILVVRISPTFGKEWRAGLHLPKNKHLPSLKIITHSKLLPSTCIWKTKQPNGLSHEEFLPHIYIYI